MANIPMTQGMIGGGGGAEAGGPSLQFSVPCLEVEDQQDRPPSFKYLFYELPFPEFPFKASFFIANGWCNGSGTYKQSMKILKPDGSLLVETGQQDVNLANSTTPFMAVNYFPELPFEGPGVYRVEVYLAANRVLSYPITVRQAGG